MDAKETIKALLEASEDGTITAEQVTQAGLHRSVLQELVKSGELYRFGRGLYVRSGIWEDELYLLQRKYGRGIYSMETALYLHGYSDRTPAQYTMTFPKGYNTPSLKQENVTIKWVQQLNYPLGIIEIPSPCGNPIRVYDLERTLCDLLRGSGGDIQIINPAIKRYVVSKDRDIHKLLQYAQQLRVQPKVQRYLEILLQCNSKKGGVCMGYLAAQGAILAIGIVIGLICSVIGLFFGHIILFDSIALGIVAGVCCNSFTPIHPALCLVIGIAVFLLLLWLQRTSVGFWVIGGLLTLIYAAAAGLLACLLTEKDLVWGGVTFGIVFLVIGGLHLHARDN